MMKSSFQFSPRILIGDSSDVSFLQVNKSARLTESENKEFHMTMRSTHKQLQPLELSIGAGGNGFRVQKIRAKLNPMLSESGSFGRYSKEQMGMFTKTE